MRTVDGYELKPCPFCGTRKVRFSIAFSEKDNYYFVECENFNCNASGPVDLGKSGAAEKWNDRQEAQDV